MPIQNEKPTQTTPGNNQGNNQGKDQRKGRPAYLDKRGSGSDRNSDSERLADPENFLDKTIEDSFPASDPPSHSPAPAAAPSAARRAPHLNHRRLHATEDLPADFKDNKRAQFEYGRRSEKSTEHFDPSSTRLEHGNPDIGNVNLGTIEADRPAEHDRTEGDDEV